MMEEAAKKGAAHKEALGAAAAEKAPQLGAFWQVFREEMSKGIKVRRGRGWAGQRA